MDRKKLEWLVSENYDELAVLMLESPKWLRALVSGKNYARFSDDLRRGTIGVEFTGDGDGWVDVISEVDPEEESFSFTHRFRTFFGGGESLRVRQALLLLALAIKLDNEERPQHRG